MDNDANLMAMSEAITRSPGLRDLVTPLIGIAIESSTFSPHRIRLADFTVTRGDSLLARYSWMGAPWTARGRVGAAAARRVAARRRGRARGVRRIEAEIVERATAADSLDGMFFDIHGAMSVVGRTAAEARLAAAGMYMGGALSPRRPPAR